MYASGPEGLAELDAQYPKRPHNHALTMPFAELFKQLFNPLTRNTASNPAAKARRGAPTISPTEQRRHTIETFFSRWRNEVGKDIYPAMRLILPDSDRDRSVYRLKEQTIAKLLIKLVGISSKSEDGHSLLNWKVPGKSASSRLAGDFAGRCYEALKKRPLQTEPGEMRIGEVNVLLDKLAGVSGEAEQLPIFKQFYLRMNPEEMQWLIRIILKQMKIGASERTMLNAWHPDAEKLFNVSSSLRHVCWELWDPLVTLEEEKSQLSLMNPFQPQLARYPMPTIEKTIKKLGLPDSTSKFYIEEKLDGERMQMHMQLDDNDVFKFGFWSRKGKNYTYLYGESSEDPSSALTRHLEGVFDKGVNSCILDGEMIAWDPKMNKMLAFGTLKTAALNMQKNPFDKQGWRPLFRVFDCLYLNGQDLTNLVLSERRRAVDRIIVKEIPGRFERHPYEEATQPKEIEEMLREIVANSSEGLVIKNPHSVYELNRRPDSWVKVKPEYMTEYGENLDCVIIGGYYGSGHRGGIKSSFMCGLRARRGDIDNGSAGPETFYSFFKVGGGLRAEDYAEIEHHTDGKWKEWDPKAAKPYVVLSGENKYCEKPDVWIRPSDSVVVEVKAARAEPTSMFSVGSTLRFPRFRRIRHDKKWNDGALDRDEWENLNRKVEQELIESREMEMEEKRRSTRKRQKRELTVAGEAQVLPPVDMKSKLFEGKTFYLTGGSKNPKKPREELEKLIKEHGGVCTKNPASVRDGLAIPLADRVTARALAITKMEGVNIFMPKWALDCIQQNYILPFETDHLYAATDETYALAAENSDRYGDSYCRDVDVDELRKIFEQMKEERGSGSGRGRQFDVAEFYDQLEAAGHELPRSRGYVFWRCRVLLVPVDGVSELTMARLRSFVGFGNGNIVETLNEGDGVTHVVVVIRGHEAGGAAAEIAARIRRQLSERVRMRIPRLVTEKWIEDCWKEETRVSEEEYAVS